MAIIRSSAGLDSTFLPAEKESLREACCSDRVFGMYAADHMWWTSRGWNEIDGHDISDTHHPHQAAPLCAPCNYARNTSDLPFPQPNGCPCTPELLCKADHKGATHTP